MKKIVWICTGDIAHYPGKIGDVFVNICVADYLQKLNYKIYFITNEFMFEKLQNTYEKIDFSLMNKNNLSENDLLKCKEADFIFIMKPFENLDGNNLEKQLLDSNIQKNKTFRVGSLDSFSVNGPHITEQILNYVLKKLDEEKPEKDLYPLLKLKFNISKQFDYIILPFAGNKNKWMPEKLLVELISHLKGKIGIFGAPYEEELEKISYYKNKLKEFTNITISATNIEEVCYFSSKCREIFCMDGGLTWSVVSYLNYLGLNKKLKKNKFPLIKVITGRDLNKNLPTSQVWRPISIYQEKIIEINEKQELKIKDIKIEMLLK